MKDKQDLNPQVQIIIYYQVQIIIYYHQNLLYLNYNKDLDIYN